MNSPSQRITMQALIERAHLRGISPSHLSEELLKELKDEGTDLIAWGRVRIYEGEDEVLPRRIFAEPIPTTFWRQHDSVSDKCESNWIDHPEKPSEFSEIDWLSGSAAELRWEFNEQLEHRLYRWTALEFEASPAIEIIDAISRGEPRKSRRAIDQARSDFIANYSGVGGMDGAWRAFKTNPALYDMTTQAEFRRQYREIRGIRGPGAPRKNP
jgi:hypothetical protein